MTWHARATAHDACSRQGPSNEFRATLARPNGPGTRSHGRGHTGGAASRAPGRLRRRQRALRRRGAGGAATAAARLATPHSRASTPPHPYAHPYPTPAAMRTRSLDNRVVGGGSRGGGGGVNT